MNSIVQAFSGRRAFIPFITCGDPDIETTEKLVGLLAENGADLIELGIPFSDTTAEGEVVQESNNRALASGTTTDTVFEMITRLNNIRCVPIMLRTYANVVFSYGTERFVSRAADIGVSGLILSDVPFEEKDEFNAVCDRYGISYISSVVPYSLDRCDIIAAGAEGFLYCTLLGGDGDFDSKVNQIDVMVNEMKNHVDKELFCAVDLDISTPQEASKAASVADGVVIGSAFDALLGKYGRDGIDEINTLAKSFRAAI